MIYNCDFSISFWARSSICLRKSPHQPPSPMAQHTCPQHERGSPSTTEAEARMRNLFVEQGNQVTALHFLRGTTVPHSNYFVLHILTEILHSLLFSGISPYFFRHSLQSAFFTVINRYSSQVYTAHAQNKKLGLLLQTDFFKKLDNNQILKLCSIVNN